jgi:hypothetical protein
MCLVCTVPLARTLAVKVNVNDGVKVNVAVKRVSATRQGWSVRK